MAAQPAAAWLDCSQCGATGTWMAERDPTQTTGARASTAQSLVPQPPNWQDQSVPLMGSDSGSSTRMQKPR